MSNPPRHPHLGQIIEGILLERGMTKAEFARRISTSRQNVSLILKKQSMDSELLWRIGLVLETNLFPLLAAAFSEEAPLPESSTRTGKLEIRLEIADHRLVRLTSDLVRQVVQEHRSARLEIADGREREEE